MVGAAVGDAGMMGELSPVPLGRRQSRHSDRQHRTVPTGVIAIYIYRFGPFCTYPNWKPPHRAECVPKWETETKNGCKRRRPKRGLRNEPLV